MAQDEGRKYGAADKAQENTFSIEGAQHKASKLHSDAEQAAHRAGGDYFSEVQAKHDQLAAGSLGRAQPQAHQGQRRTSNGQNASPDGQDRDPQQQAATQQQPRQGLLGTLTTMLNEFAGRKAEEIQQNQQVQQAPPRQQVGLVSQPAPQQQAGQKEQLAGLAAQVGMAVATRGASTGQGMAAQQGVGGMNADLLASVRGLGANVKEAGGRHMGQSQQAPQAARDTPGMEAHQAKKQAEQAAAAPQR